MTPLINSPSDHRTRDYPRARCYPLRRKKGSRMMKQFTLMMVVLAVALSTACQVEPKKSSYEPVSAYKAVEVAPKPKPASDRQARNREKLPLGMVAIPVLKKKVGMSDEQIKKVRAVYKSFRPHAEEADATIQDANDKKAAHWAAQPLRKKIFDAVRRIKGVRNLFRRP